MNTREDRISELLLQLRKEEKYHLAETIESHHQKSIAEYSRFLLDYSVQHPIETVLLDAFREELLAMNMGESDIEEILHELRTHRLIQAAPHTGLCPSPRMLCIDWLTTCALPADRWYVIGSFAGVPFSNNSRPGRLRFDGQEINCIPKTMQDALVYSSTIPEKSLEQYALLPQELRDIIPEPHLGANFALWACASQQAIERHILQHEKLVVLDINAVVTRYMIKIIKQQQAEHPIYKMLFNNDFREQFFVEFGTDLHLFYAPYDKKKYQKQESLYYDGYSSAVGNNTHIHLEPDILIETLRERRLCPATILTFTALAFVNHFKCFGSFSQVEYLPKFQKHWENLEEIPDVATVPTKNLTTGMFPSNSNLEALDIILSKTDLPGNGHDTWGDYLLPIWSS